MSKKHTGPFWGLFDRSNEPVFADFASNAMCVGPAGSGKGITSVVPNIFAIRHSKVIADFKGELVCLTKQALEDDLGERVIVLNPGGLHADQLEYGDG